MFRKGETMIIDTHAHYDDEQFDVDRKELLLSMEAKGVEAIINIGSDYGSLECILRLTEEFPFLYGAMGIHPDAVGQLTEERFARLEAYVKHPKVVAVGEIGLDYHWNVEKKEVQKYWLIRQLELARRHHLPVVIHSRDAASDTMEIMKRHGQEMKAVIHCYSYGKEQAKEYVRMGYRIGIGGVLTFKNARKLKETAAEIPLDRILLETDAPYLAPEPFRGKRNNSLYISYIAEALARIKGISVEEVLQQTRENAREFYRNMSKNQIQ